MNDPLQKLLLRILLRELLTGPPQKADKQLAARSLKRQATFSHECLRTAGWLLGLRSYHASVALLALAQRPSNMNVPDRSSNGFEGRRKRFKEFEGFYGGPCKWLVDLRFPINKQVVLAPWGSYSVFDMTASVLLDFCVSHGGLYSL